MSVTSMPIDYYVSISLSEDKLTAYLQFSNVDERFSCTVEQLAQLLKAQHIHYGVRYEALEQFAAEPGRFYHTKVIVAQGEKPLDGEDGYIVFMFDEQRKEKRPAERDDGRVDYKEVARLINVRKGELIAQRIPATEGVPGRAVTGEALFMKKGKEVRFKIGKNVVCDQDMLKLYASIDGMVVKTDRGKLNVFPVYEVNGDVDYKTGNIDFIGTVVVRGSVINGFRVKAEGDIRITGGVEAAELEAGGSIEISAGILGHNKGLIKAGRNVKSSFIQDANVMAGEEVIVSQSIMHSHVRAGRQVVCQGAKGLIVGGTIQSGETVVARTIGNSMSTNTTIEVGVLPELRHELQEARGQLKLQLENLDKTEKAVHLLDQLAAAGQLSGDKLAMRIKLQHTRKQTLNEIEQLKEKTYEIEKSLENTDKAYVAVSGLIYGGTKIVIGRYTRFVKEQASRVCFKYIDGDIAMLPNI